MDSHVLQSCMQSFKRLLSVPVIIFNGDLLGNCMRAFDHFIGLEILPASRRAYERLKIRIYALPQELKDAIMDNNIIPQRGIRYLDEVAERLGYSVGPVKRPLLAPPVEMAGRKIDQFTRRQFLRRFYDDRESVFVVPYLGGKSVQFCVRWLRMLGKEQRCRIKDIRCVIAPPEVAAAITASKDDARGRFRGLDIDHRTLFGSEAEITMDPVDYQSSEPAITPTTTANLAHPVSVNTINQPLQTATESVLVTGEGNFQGTGHVVGAEESTETGYDDSGIEIDGAEEITEEEAEEMFG